MKIKLKIEKEFDVKTLSVRADVRYWEDGTINGTEDVNGDLTPCREGESWCPEIDIETGRIINWKEGATAELHYKVCDAGVYTLKDANGNTITEKDGYVPSCMCPKESGYGDYIIMDIDENGFIKDWEFDETDFTDED